MGKRTWITVKRGLLEPKHREQIGPAIWLYLYILDRANWEQGAVLEWIDANAADELEFDLNTLRSHRRRLEEHGYITCQKKQHSQKVYINNWTNPREYSGKTYNQTYKSQSVADTELSEDVESSSQSGNQSSSQSSSQPIHKPTTPTSNSKDKNQKSKDNEEHPHKEMVAALAEVMGVDLGISANWGRLGKQAKSLLEADYSPSDVRSAFGKGGYWYKNDWRGKKGQLPDQSNINKHIGVYSGRLRVETDTSPREDLERRLEMLNEQQ